MILGRELYDSPLPDTDLSPTYGGGRDMTAVAIVGIGESRVRRLRGMSALRLTLEAARSAIQDAGVTASAIDGVLTRNLDMDVTGIRLKRDIP